MQKTVQQQRQEFLEEVWDSARRLRDAKRPFERNPEHPSDRRAIVEMQRAERELFRVVDKFEWWTMYGTGKPKDSTEADTQ